MQKKEWTRQDRIDAVNKIHKNWVISDDVRDLIIKRSI